MKFRKVPGRKGDGDEILLGETEGEEAITMTDAARIVVHWYHNEERLYPPSRNPKLLGGEKFMHFLRDCIREPEKVDLIALQYKLRKGVKIHLGHFM